MGFFGFGKKNKEKEQEKMKTGLEKTRTGFWGNILNTLTGSVIDDDMYDDLEEQLILADVGGEVAVRLVDKLRDRVHEKGLKTGEEAADALRDIIAEEMTPDAEMDLSGKPAVILVIGVNGVGKTTSIAKLADHYTREGKKVMLAAGDTFRAAASEQLEIWADRAGVPIVSAGEGGHGKQYGKTNKGTGDNAGRNHTGGNGSDNRKRTDSRNHAGGCNQRTDNKKYTEGDNSFKFKNHTGGNKTKHNNPADDRENTEQYERGSV